ncbi:MAG TPA: FtsX-like permease family protein [Burkholderiales bacterium]|nr:FtsX-like permease family protein [Burkholderiales bacterium]
MKGLAFRMLLRDWRAGELRVLALALVIAVSSVTSVGFFADRVRQALSEEAQQLIGGDVVLSADHALPPQYERNATERGLEHARAVNFISMARTKKLTQLVGVKGVNPGYPLRGELRIAAAPGGEERIARGIPPQGSVWVDERLLPLLNVKVGSEIELGDMRFRIDALLRAEPDRGASFFNIAPRVLINETDVEATGLVQAGSRANFFLYVAGERTKTRDYEIWLKKQLARGEELQSLDNARPEMQRALERAQQFLGLTALLAVILAAVAVGLSTRRYTRRHLDSYAVMRCLGATQKRLTSLFVWEFIALGLIACAVGCALGYAAQVALEAFLGELVAATLPQPSLLPAVQGYITGLILLLGFALPPLLQLKNVPSLRVIRRDLGLPKQSALLAYGLGFVSLAALLIWQAGDPTLAMYVLSGFVGAFFVFALAGYLSLRIVAALGKRAQLAWRYGFASLKRRSRSNTVQILSLSLGLMAILLLAFIHNDLLAAWRAQTPSDAPNRFMVNVQPDQREPMVEFFAANGLPPFELHPMIRGRLLEINGQPINIERYDEPRTRRLAEREFNLSYDERLPSNNVVSQGRWFGPQEFNQGALSVEAGLAERLGIRIGDTITWNVAGERFSAPVTNLRTLEWDSMQVNFFVIGTPALLRDMPTTYISSFHVGGEHSAAMTRLSQRFPNITIIDVSAILRQAMEMIDQVARAVQFVFLFALGAGILVLYAALLATQDERAQEAAVMRALGASRAQVRTAQRAEFLALGLIAGLLASTGASVVGHVVAWKVFNLSYATNPWIWVVGPALALVCVSLNAWVGTRAALARPPIYALREA